MYTLDEDVESYEEEDDDEREKHLESMRLIKLFDAVDILLNVDTHSNIMRFYYSYITQQVTGKGMLA